ncbi:hypothetical protein SCG7086_BE_00080 [Chlamydiales bacterium SCGC AG-110-P3]|nr:hypothetical protein SCG7086_BE_00080 [Chlamydiales bacterium SCGC AG-110-P3]
MEAFFFIQKINIFRYQPGTRKPSCVFDFQQPIHQRTS